MKKIFLTTLIIFSMVFPDSKAEKPGGLPSEALLPNTIVYLTNETFKKMIFDYETNKEWKYLGTKPAIIDFYADWCGPCKQLSPLVEELAKEYSGRIIVYKVDTDKEKVLARNLGISSIPTLLFIPAQGQPRMSVGVLPKTSLVKAVNEVLMIK